MIKVTKLTNIGNKKYIVKIAAFQRVMVIQYWVNINKIENKNKTKHWETNRYLEQCWYILEGKLHKISSVGRLFNDSMMCMESKIIIKLDIRCNMRKKLIMHSFKIWNMSMFQYHQYKVTHNSTLIKKTKKQKTKKNDILKIRKFK